MTKSVGTDTFFVSPSPLIFMNPVSSSLLAITTAIAPASAACFAFVPNVQDPRRTTAIAPATAATSTNGWHAFEGFVLATRFAEKACVSAEDRSALPFTPIIRKCAQCASSLPAIVNSQILYVPSQWFMMSTLLVDMVTPTATAFFALDGALYVPNPCTSSKPELPTANIGRKVSLRRANASTSSEAVRCLLDANPQLSECILAPASYACA